MLFLSRPSRMFLFSRPYQRQVMAMIPGFLSMICGGMFLSYGVFNIMIGYQTWTVGRSTTALYVVLASFHISVIVGAVATGLIYKLIDVFKIHLVNSSLMMIASIILIALPDSYPSVLSSRLIFGLGFGSSYLKFIIYGSEITSPKVRAQMLFLLHFFLTFGMFLFSLLCLIPNFALIMRLMGSISAALTLVSTALGYFKLKSSHIFMMQNHSKDALERFQYFQQDSSDNPHVESETMQTYIIEEKKRRCDFFGRHNISALAVILLVKIGYLSVFNGLHNFYRAVFLSVYLSTSSTNYSTMIMMATRLFGCTIGFFVLDRITKRIQYFIPAIVISSILFIFGILLQAYPIDQMWTPIIFFIPLEFFLGVGLSPMAEILKGELFPLKEKPVSIATTIVFGELVHILCIILLYTWILGLGSTPRILPFVFGTVTLVCGIGVIILLKDSRKQSLRLVSNLYSDK